MGRPLNKRFFGNTNPDGVGGEAVDSVTVVAGDSADYASTDTVTFGLPDVPGGARATGTIVVDEDGAVTGITVTNGGSGYTSAPTVTITTSTGTQTTLTLTAVLTSVRLNAILAYAYLEGGSNKIADIVRQVGSRRYVVKTADGQGVCRLVTDGIANEAGEMTITATDSEGNLYFVDKITSRLVRLYRIEDESTVGTWLYANGEMAPWSFAAASGKVVSVANN